MLFGTACAEARTGIGWTNCGDSALRRKPLVNPLAVLGLGDVRQRAVGDGSRCDFQCRRESFSYPRRDFLLFRRDPYETQARLRSSGARLLSANAVALPSTFFQFLLLLPSALALLPFQVQPSQARLQMRIRHGRSKYSVLLPTRTTPVGGHVRVGATTNPPPLSSSVLIWCNSRHGRYVPKKQCTLNWSGA